MRRLMESLATTTRFRDRDDLDLAVARLVAEMFDPDRIAIHRLEDAQPPARVRAGVVLERGGRLADDPRDSGRIAPDERTATRNACLRDGDPVHFDGASGALSIYPIFTGAELARIVEIEFDPGRDSLGTRDRGLLAAVLRIVDNHLGLLDYSERDTLTGLMNRRTFESAFDKTRDRVAQVTDCADPPSWLGILDIDRFKAINDRYGHLFGDEVLLLVSQLLRDALRGTDQLFRFGGEEFSVIVERCDADHAQRAFERLRSTVASRAFPQLGTVTISVGYTQIRPLEAASSAFERADSALYFAKNHGRDQIWSYEELLAERLVQEVVLPNDAELF